MRVFFIMSFILLSDRRKVDLPHPEGPIKAVTWFFLISILTLFSALSSP
jgi:hypothetical protein